MANRKIEQGDLLKIDVLNHPAIVVSNNFFNESGKAIVCPIVKSAAEGPLHIKLKQDLIEGYVLCEQLRYVDLAARHFSKLTASHYDDRLDISDAVMGMFDYQAL